LEKREWREELCGATTRATERDSKKKTEQESPGRGRETRELSNRLAQQTSKVQKTVWTHRLRTSRRGKGGKVSRAQREVELSEEGGKIGNGMWGVKSA